MLNGILLATFTALTWTDLDWKIGKGLEKYVRIDDGILTVDVPKGVSNVCAYATAALDLGDFDRRALEVEVRAKAEDIVVDRRPARGFKVSLHYKDPLSGAPCYPSPRKYAKGGSFDWETVRLLVPFGELAPVGDSRLVLGIQQASGKAVFDLRTLVVRRALPLFPSEDIDRKVSYPARLADLPPLHGVMSLGTLRNTEKDIDDLHRMGATLVRLQMNGFGRKNDPNFRGTMAAWNAWFARWLEHADKVLGWLETRGMKMALDMHNPPVGSYGDRCSTFNNPEHAARFISAWVEIARRYRGRPGLYGYDLINEPTQNQRALPDCDQWNLQRRAAEAIRRIDPDATIIVEANDWDSPEAFGYLRAFDMDNVIYQAHMYRPGQYTHQGANGTAILPPERLLSYPSATKRFTADRETLVRNLRPVRDFQLRHDCRIFIGEFSCALYAPGAAEWLADCIDIFLEYGWDWTYHSFREARYWNVETVLDAKNRNVPNIENPRYFALVNGFKPTVPVMVENRVVKLADADACGRCTAVAETGTAGCIRFAALASASFADGAAIGDAVAMTVVWRKADGSEIRRETVPYRDFLEAGHRYRAFEGVLAVPEGTDGKARIELDVKRRPGEVRFAGIRAQKISNSTNGKGNEDALPHPQDVGYAGSCSIECETNFKDNLAECVGYFKALMKI